MDCTYNPPLLSGKPGQFNATKTWCDIIFLLHDEFAQCAGKQAEFFASLFRGPVRTWLATHPQKSSLLTDYGALVAAVQQAWDKSDTVREDAQQRLATISQRGSVRNYAIELSTLFDCLDTRGSVRKAIFVQGLKPSVRRALVLRDDCHDYEGLVQKAERLDPELWACRSRRASS
ncbi:hypothetical protein ASPFODRAFT_213002 [Aspergillus luchuensis CBS 106.47]|uniref:Retrotransposon gag domain-containing protein n=1 Tax=Aspergillus luchuensis (strain CBS 106.47) TaxID=1137211 RepID=A0A1M3SZG8_ASPLC|nr:hypothetical protein ASPFODRAFT_213002 [Aspergillus luchuensis CBS 106.47]